MHAAVDPAQLRDQVGHGVIARDHGGEPAHHDITDIGIRRQHAQQLVAADADNLGRLHAHCLREAARVFSSSAAQPNTSPFFRICVERRACTPGSSACSTLPETMM